MVKSSISQVKRSTRKCESSYLKNHSIGYYKQLCIPRNSYLMIFIN